MHTRLVFTTAATLIVFMAQMHAQPRVVPPKFEGTNGWVHLLSIEVNTIANAPYMADVVRETVQVLSDGNRIVSRKTGRVMRDSAGRVRREEDLANGRVEVSIHDPVARTMTELGQVSKTARVSGLPRSILPSTPSGWRMVYGSGPGGSFARNVKVDPKPEPTVETLPQRSLEGVAVTGQRKTTTIAAGEIGNEKPIHITAEEWRSTELQVLVLTEFNDPRTSRTTYSLTNIRRVEPPATAFLVPEGYRIIRGPNLIRNR